MNAPAYATRRAKIREQAAELGLDLLAISAPANVAYLTGFTGSNGQVLLAADPSQSDMLLTDRRYEGRVDSVDIAVAYEPLPTVAARFTGTLGIEAEHVNWATATRLTDELDAHGIRVTATTGVVETFRQTKDSYELAQLATACQITVAAVTDVLTHCRLVGMSERDIAARIAATMRQHGGHGDAFPAIVAAGVNGAIPHHNPTSRPVQAGEFLTIDCGTRINGYHADYTRTVAVAKAPSGVLDGIYAVVQQAQATATAALTAGVRSHDVDAAARDVITQAGYGAQFVHGTGHGVGLDIHEAPLIGPHQTARIAATVTCTSEPGIYLPDVGGVRIEDTVVVTPDGKPQILTESTRDLLIV